MTHLKDYSRDLIEEYNARFRSWGNSESWGQSEFKTLEDMICESTKIRINSSTLKRFFHQKTANPQLATNNALCMFLGYAGYAEFVMKINDRTKNAPDSQGKDAKSSRLSKRTYTALVIAGAVLFGIIIFQDAIREKCEEMILSSVVFRSAATKGASPYTVKIEYHIPNFLADHISADCIESNGDVVTKKLAGGTHDFNVTFIYPGTAHCHLKYRGKIIRSIDVISRTGGWSTYIKEEKSDSYHVVPFADASIANGRLTLPVERIPQQFVTDKLFVSYTYYADSIADGDNFIAEARVRNSAAKDHGIPCYDVMMYVFSNTGLHGFALNENCYSYLKFISSENIIAGSQHDFSRVNFNPTTWHIMRIETVNKKTKFYLDGEMVLQTDYRTSLGAINELTLRFKGCGSVDYVRIMNLQNQTVFQEDF